MARRKKSSLSEYILAAIFLAIALVLPIFTGQIPQIGKALCPMHIPVLLCGYFCGPWLGMGIGFIAPLLRSIIFSTPVLIPNAIGMAFELATYGFIAGYLYKYLPKSKFNIYFSLICAMLLGRIVWGASRVVLYNVAGYEFGWSAFIAGALTSAIPGIIAQIIIVPILVMALKNNSR